MRSLREGDRDAFIRFFRLFRAPVHHFAWRLLRDDAAASGATRDALTAAFRRAILDDDVTDLETLTFRCALEACEARSEPAQGAPGTGSPVAPGVRRRSGGPEESAARQRFEAALESLEPGQRAALLLHDLQGMDPVRLGEVLGLGAEAAGALLFRAREEFRERLQERPGYVSERKCRQAEEALAGAVGLGMDDLEFSRLHRHAGYCRPCRKVMKTWTAANVGLAAVLPAPPLPEALAAAPVFGDVVDGLVPGAGQSRRGVPLLAARTTRALKGRAAAWVFAVACLALAGGLVVHGLGLRQSVLMQSVGPAIRLIVAPPADGSEPAAARGIDRETTATTGPAIGISSAAADGSATATSAGPALPGTPVDDAAPGESTDDAAPTESTDESAPPGEAPSAGGSPSDRRDSASETEEPGQSASSAADSGKVAKANGKAAKADGKKCDDKKSDDKKSDDKKSDDKKSDGKKSDGRKSDGKKSDGKKSDGKKSDGKKSDGKKSDGKKSDGKKAD